MANTPAADPQPVSAEETPHASEAPAATPPDQDDLEAQAAALEAALLKTRAELQATLNRLRAETDRSLPSSPPSGGGLRAWIDAHPGLTMGLAVGAGILLGGALTSASRTTQGRALLADARQLAEEAAATVVAEAADVGARLHARTADTRQALSDEAAQVRAVLRTQADHLADAAIDQLTGVMDTVEERLDGVKETVLPRPHLRQLIWTSLRTVLTMALMRRLGDWIRR